MTGLHELLDDLEAEYRDVHRMVAQLGAGAPEWDRMTPSEGWMVRDQISHLAFFDDAARLAATEPEQFARMVEAFVAQTGDPMGEHLARGRSMDGAEILGWWERAHAGMAEALAGADPKARVPWFGPPMGVMSFVSARLMETWAHGQDVADALGIERVATDRLRHIAHLGVRARPFSYLVRSRDVPVGRIDVVLTAPSGEEWRWEIGEEGAGAPAGVHASSVRGSALEFCLVVTQRRNVADTALVVEGDTATDWLSIAQAFAGPPGQGRAPSQ